jgi:hypothetical protein
MQSSRIRYATLAVLVILTVMSSGAWAQQTRLSARKNKVINGIEAQLRGDYREKSSPSRLNSELEDINIPVGTKVAFCLVQDGVKTLVGVGQVAMIGGIPTASFELNANDGDMVPNVNAGDVLQARQRTTAPFAKNPTCNSALMVSASFK